MTIDFRCFVPVACLLPSWILPACAQQPGNNANNQAAPAESAAAPQLILQITVDQLRGDLPARYLDRMGDGGFRYLLENGVVYANAHHAHAATETVVGHTTLATGAHPSVHGMIGNSWFDRVTGRPAYNIEDDRYALLTAGADVDDSTEIDPTQRAATSEGRSPAAILSSTFGDELAIKTAGKAKVFGVSVKDRGAVSMAGHAGVAFWFSKATGEFVTSNFYYDRYPQWVEDFNATNPAQRYAGEKWELMTTQDSYLFGDKDDQAWETVFELRGGDKDEDLFAGLPERMRAVEGVTRVSFLSTKLDLPV